jgi:uncharacterized protein (DUF2062 family)
MKFKVLRPMMRFWRSKAYRPGLIGWSLGIGMVIGFSPTIGLQMIICIAICLGWNRLHSSKLNLPAMLVGSLVVNPLTMAPTYVLYYQIGCRVVECHLSLNEEFFMSLGNVTQLGAGIIVPVMLGSIPFMIAALPAGIYLGNRVESLLEARRLRRRSARKPASQAKVGGAPASSTGSTSNA